MTPEELLKPRYKVIQPDTSGRWAAGDIYTFKREVAQSYDYWIDQKGNEISFNFFSAFPHLFKKLEWHEDRKESDMPEYIISSHRGEDHYVKVDVWNKGLSYPVTTVNGITYYAPYSKPITKEEYENQTVNNIK